MLITLRKQEIVFSGLNFPIFLTSNSDTHAITQIKTTTYTAANASSQKGTHLTATVPKCLRIRVA